MARELTYLNFDVLLERGEQGAYRARVVNAPAGQTPLVAFTMPFTPLELDNFVLRIGRPRRVVRRIDAPETAAIKTFGGQLYRALFHDQVEVNLLRSLSEAAAKGAGLRIRLRLSDTPELAQLPWEFLYDQTRNRFLALSDRTPLVRFLEVSDPPRPLTVSPPLQVLVMIASPSDYPQLDVEQEWTKLRTALAPLEQAGQIQVTRLENATLTALRQQLRRADWHVLHFIGHGGFDPQIQDGVLVLEDQTGRSRLVSGQDLGTLLHDHDPLRLVVLNACEGARADPSDPFAATAQSLIQHGTPAVVAMQFEITDPAAISFASELYAAVNDGYPLDAALAEARKAIWTDGNQIEWAAPVLHLRVPDAHIFEVAPPAPSEAASRAAPSEAAQRAPSMPTTPSEPTLDGPSLASTRVAMHVLARMDSVLAVQQISTVGVILARVQLWRSTHPTEVSGQAEVAPDRSLVVEVIPRANLEALGDTQAKISVPTSGQPALLLFNVRATNPGPGELWVLVRQDQLTLLTLVLQPRVAAPDVSPTATMQLDDQGALQESGRAIIGDPGRSLTMLRIVEQRHGDAIVFRYDLDAPDIGLWRAYASPLLEHKREEYVRGLFARIEQAWLDSDQDIEAFQAELRAFGGALLEELFPTELQQDLWEYRNRLTHIVVVSTEPFIPWELVHLKPPGARKLPAETCFLAQLGLVRWLLDARSSRPPEHLVLRPTRARFVIPDYPHQALQLPETASERAFLATHLDATAVEPHHRQVLALLDDPGGPDGFDLLHFAGHGLAASDEIGDAQVLLEGRREGNEYIREPLRATTVAQHFQISEGAERSEPSLDEPVERTPSGGRPIVVLNACQTGRLGYQLASIGGFAEAFVGGGAGAFISSLWSVGDTPARTFVETLYEALLDGQPMAQAVRSAREAARAAGDATWLAYTVYAHPNATLEAS